MLRTIRKGLYKSNNVRFLALLIAVAFVLLTEMACVGNMTAKAETAGDVYMRIRRLRGWRRLPAWWRKQHLR